MPRTNDLHRSIPARANLMISAGIVLYHAFVLVALPLWLLPRNPAWGLVLLPLCWLNSTQWGLIHEGVHKLLLPNSRANETLSRLLSALLGASFHVLRFGHLTHHQLNRDWHSEYVQRRSLKAHFDYYWNLLVGLYVSEVASSLLLAVVPRATFVRLARTSFLKEYPQVAVTGERVFYERGAIRAVRQDALAVLLVYGAAFWLYGVHWPMLLGFLGLRALVISLMDNIYHYGTPRDNSRASKELSLPPLLAACILNNNYHETHHLNPLLPWSVLPVANREEDRGFDGGLLAHGLVQFSGPLLHSA